ncbi:MAG: 3-hydroxyacyl-CoA dehydrogenase NAD-binding domain-containing protein [Alphaproteobacteria bacterium]
MNERVTYAKHGTVGVITVDNPPVNALSVGVPQGIIDALAKGEADPEIAAFVLLGAGRGFIAGADIREFGKPRPAGAATIRDVIARLETSPKPVVAAIHGVAFGGGLEVAMGCHYRCAVAGARLGQPEVKLGILPGAGGTQRLPRLVGVGAALEMIVGGEPIVAGKALELGLVDELIEGDLAAGALAFAERLAAEGQPPRKARDDDSRLDDGDDAPFDAMRERIARRARGQLAPFHCIEAVAGAVRLPFDDGIARERELFEECLASPQSKALMHVFFAERAAARVDGISKETPTLRVETAAVVGAGTMGGGIAMCFANAGIPVTLLDRSRGDLDKGMARVRANYEASVRRGRLDQGEMDARMARIAPRLDYGDLADADIVIEAVFEEMDLKREVFRALDGAVKPGAILATNTSYQDVNALARETRRPEKVLGTHFFSPANVMRLLEIVRGEATGDETLATTIKLGRALGKVGVVVGVCHGFVGNRMLSGYLREANFLIEEGALPRQVDGVIEEFGFPMGPFAVGDLAGLDIGWRVRKAEAATRRNDLRYSPIADRLCEQGRFGQKTGAGWYRYEAGSRAPIPDRQVEALIVATSAELGIARRDIDDDEILSRCLYPLINEGARILEDGIAARAGDIDIVWINGYAFPAYRGGPMHYADHVGLDNVCETIERHHDVHGEFWQPAPLLEKLARDGKGFADLYR